MTKSTYWEKDRLIVRNFIAQLDKKHSRDAKGRRYAWHVVVEIEKASKKPLDF